MIFIHKHIQTYEMLLRVDFQFWNSRMGAAENPAKIFMLYDCINYL